MAMALKNNEKHKSETLEDVELDPKTVRQKAGLTAEEMASLMAMSGFGYTAWENGTRRPGGPAYQLLRLLDENPATVAKALLP